MFSEKKNYIWNIKDVITEGQQSTREQYIKQTQNSSSAPSNESDLDIL